MPKRPAIVRYIRACAKGQEDRAVSILDEMTPWRGLAEVAADVAGPALTRSVIGQLATGKDALADSLEELAAELRAA